MKKRKTKAMGSGDGDNKGVSLEHTWPAEMAQHGVELPGHPVSVYHLCDLLMHLSKVF